MNKLVIVGNGFDLAHGLPTSYTHFMDDFWKNLKLNYEEEKIKKIVFVNPDYLKILDNPINNYNSFKKNILDYSNEYRYKYDEVNHELYNNKSRTTPIFKFENKFFKELQLNTSIENWVDIENEYYLELKRISKRQDSHYTGSRENFQKEQSIKNKKSINKLNIEFDQIKELFENYLITNIHDKFDFRRKKIVKHDTFLKIFEETPKRYSETNTERGLLTEFPKEDEDELISYDDKLYEAYNNRKIKEFLKEEGKRLVFLNFNYTSSIDQYIKIMNYNGDGGDYFNSEIIPIHGELKAKNEYGINFGFGDEMDDDYKLIENLNDNEYLKNFKSFKYSQNRHYKHLLDYIESEKFQVYIMGHSCGLSDRTMLNTIFEHKNCRSIKVFYHKRENGTDNFTEIIQNISRHFNDKKLMRSKIVNKSLCIPLPQEMRFQEKPQSN
tara:strand:- start:81650 stop:82969 length:1320 start_codon:yes stop_codon:yes gene_type:complete